MRFAKMGGNIVITCDSGPYKEVAEGLRRAEKAEVDPTRITISSDGQGSWSEYDEAGNLLAIGVSSVAAVYRQIVDLVQNEGMEFEKVLKFGTLNPAEALELSNKGRICPGADGDLLLMKQEDLSLDTVISMGRIMMRNGEILVKGTYE